LSWSFCIAKWVRKRAAQERVMTLVSGFLDGGVPVSDLSRHYLKNKDCGIVAGLFLSGPVM